MCVTRAYHGITTNKNPQSQLRLLSTKAQQKHIKEGWMIVLRCKEIFGIFYANR